MAPAQAPARSRRTFSSTWSSDSIAMRPVSKWPDIDQLESTSSGRSLDETGASAGDTSDCTDEKRIRIRASHNQARAKHDQSHDLSAGGENFISRSKRFIVSPGTSKIIYDSDSCLTPRSRRTLRRTVSGATEPWPSVKSSPSKPALDTIYSPSHEILHPMQSLRLEKLLLDNPALADLRRTKVTSTAVKADGSVGLSDSGEKSEVQTGERPLENVSSDGASPNVVVIIVDAEKKPSFAALDWAINVAVQPGDEIIILGVLKHVSVSPMGHKVVANTDPLIGVNKALLQSEVTKTTELFEHKFSDSGRRAECEKKNVKLTVRIAPGARARTVVVQELQSLKATYAIFDRNAMHNRRYYGKHLACHAVRMRSNGRSTKTITAASLSPRTPNLSLISPTSNSSSTSSTSPSPSPLPLSRDINRRASSESPTFWKRFTSFRSSRVASPRMGNIPVTSGSSTASESPEVESPRPSTAMDMSVDSFMREMQEFSISLDGQSASERMKQETLLRAACVVDARAYKKGMQQRRRPMAVAIPAPICAT